MNKQKNQRFNVGDVVRTIRNSSLMRITDDYGDGWYHCSFVDEETFGNYEELFHSSELDLVMSKEDDNKAALCYTD